MQFRLDTKNYSTHIVSYSWNFRLNFKIWIWLVASNDEEKNVSNQSLRFSFQSQTKSLLFEEVVEDKTALGIFLNIIIQLGKCKWLTMTPKLTLMTVIPMSKHFFVNLIQINFFHSLILSHSLSLSLSFFLFLILKLFFLISCFEWIQTFIVVVTIKLVVSITDHPQNPQKCGGCSCQMFAYDINSANDRMCL